MLLASLGAKPRGNDDKEQVMREWEVVRAWNQLAGRGLRIHELRIQVQR